MLSNREGGNWVNKPGGLNVRKIGVAEGQQNPTVWIIFSEIIFHLNSQLTYFATWQFDRGLQCWLIARSKAGGSHRNSRVP